MSQGYDKLFRDMKARKAKNKQQVRTKKEPILMEQLLRRNIPVKAKPKRKVTDYAFIGILVVLISVLFVGMLNVDSIVDFVTGFEVEAVSSVSAQEQEKKEVPVKDGKQDSAMAKDKPDDSYLSNLRERKTALDKREEELKRMEQELAMQKQKLEEKIEELNKMRSQISSILENQVETDDKRVNRLVEFYSNMKPTNAAKVFESLDEDLAIQVLSKMKKGDAASIMNKMSSEKTKSISEKFAGYKR